MDYSSLFPNPNQFEEAIRMKRLTDQHSKYSRPMNKTEPAALAALAELQHGLRDEPDHAPVAALGLKKPVPVIFLHSNFSAQSAQ